MSRADRLVHHFLEESARLYPEKTALVHENVRATYSEINARADALACRLVDQGVAPGDRVVLILENSLEYVVSYYAVLKAGAVAVPLSGDIKPEGLRPLLAELEPRAVISSTRFERVLQATDLAQFKVDALILKAPKLDWSPLPFPVYSWDELAHSPQLTARRKDGWEAEKKAEDRGQRTDKKTADSELPREAMPLFVPARLVRRDKSPGNQGTQQRDGRLTISDSQLASIIYTSGSTGKPKGVMLSHRNIVANTRSICRYLALTDKDIQMVVLPFFYVMGKSLLNTHFAVGGTVVLNNKFAFPASVVNQMVEEKVTGFSGVPSTYAYLLHRSPLARCRDRLGPLRYCSQAGGHMARQVKEELRRVLPDHTEIFVMYGATEAAARLTYLDPARFADRMESIGKAIPGVTLKVLDPDGREVPRGETGELTASGDNIMMGYWKDPEATARALDGNGYHTGDMAYEDPEGFYFVTGRKDSLLKVGGHRINPQEVEDALMATDLLLETVVLGVPDPLLGHRMVALAAPIRNTCTDAHILNLCARRLPKYKLPTAVKLVRALPKNSNGKIDRPKCLKLLD